MEDFKPNPISEYYIAYFDILGYKSFFNDNTNKAHFAEKENEYLNAIYDAINNFKKYVEQINQSPIMQNVASISIQYKIFSDNVFLCMDVSNEKKIEKLRLTFFMAVVAEFQRNFILKHNLFVRGGITKGTLSINNDFVFGKGLVEVVGIEESAKQPRIEISNKITEYLDNIQLYTREEADRAISIENRSKSGEKISDDDYNFYQQMLSFANQEYFIKSLSLNLRYLSNDNVVCLSYLYTFDVTAFVPTNDLFQLLEFIKKSFPDDYSKLNHALLSSSNNIVNNMKSHKNIIEQKLKKHSNYLSFAINDTKSFDVQESVLKKYVWVMLYHNYMCEFYNTHQLHINTIANCEKRHMKLIIFVTE